MPISASQPLVQVIFTTMVSLNTEGQPDETTKTVGIDTLLPYQAAGSVSTSVSLPPFEKVSALSQRHEVNPALALNLLNDIQVVIITWQAQLRQLVQAIHALTAQGPMVNGWLESVVMPSTGQKTAVQEAEATLLRHGDADALMQYVDALEQRKQAQGVGSDRVEMGVPTQSNTTQSTATQRAANDIAGNVPEQFSAGAGAVGSEAVGRESVTHYRLCSLAEDGSVRSHPCPPEQMAMVSTAIARYQKFKQLTAQKEAIEIKLQQSVDHLTGLRGLLQEG
ncbi:MAG: hypothetical protein AAGC93_04015 [Cyanobacteria bacterium P01_F01_bin.53]